MWSHSLSVSIIKTQKLLWISPLPWAFYFSLSSFPSPSTWSGPWPSPPSWSSPFAQPVGMCYPISWSLRVKGLALRASLIHQNQTRAFNLPLFGNWWQPFHKDMNWNSFESMLLAQAYLPWVKGFGKFHEPKLVALAPPTYVLSL